MCILQHRDTRIRSLILTLQLILFDVHVCSSAIVTTRDRLYNSVFKDYNAKTFPVLDYRKAVEIEVNSYIVSLNKFNELSGELALTLYFSLQWREERISWNTTDFDGIDSILVSPLDIWKPSFFIIQSSEKLHELGNISLFLRLNYDGDVYWTPADEYKLTCSVDVSYFPFDKQVCKIEFIAIGYRTWEVHVNLENNQLDKSIFTTNSQWDVLPSEVSNCSDERSSTCFRIHLQLKRKSEFYIVYIFVPLIFLGTMNNLVFAMPASCGERTSVAVTTFLSFVVYMSIVNSIVPQSSSPLSYLYVYLMFLMVYSSAILFLCIVSLRIYNHVGKVPCLIKGIVILLRCRCFRHIAWNRLQKVKDLFPNPRKTTLQEEKEINNESFTDAAFSENKNDINRSESEIDEATKNEGEGQRKEITWYHVGRTFDIFWLIFLYLIYFLTTAFMFSLLYVNKGFK